jgi:membrane protease YdiL (CAAX protease family)
MARTPMPKNSYGIAILVLNAVGSSSTAAYICSRWLKDRGSAFAPIYLTVLATITIWGAALFPAKPLVGSPRTWPAAMLLGILGAYFAGWVDQTIKRHGRKWPQTINGNVPIIDLTRACYAPSGLAPTAAARSRGRASADYGYSGWLLIAIAIFEEIIYRGWLIETCRLIPAPALRASSMILSILVFACIHLHLGWANVVRKAGLGSIALMSALITGTVLTAVIVHVGFNVTIWKQYVSENNMV